MVRDHARRLPQPIRPLGSRSFACHMGSLRYSGAGAAGVGALADTDERGKLCGAGAGRSCGAPPARVLQPADAQCRRPRASPTPHTAVCALNAQSDPQTNALPHAPAVTTPRFYISYPPLTGMSKQMHCPVSLGCTVCFSRHIVLHQRLFTRHVDPQDIVSIVNC